MGAYEERQGRRGLSQRFGGQGGKGGEFYQRRIEGSRTTQRDMVHGGRVDLGNGDAARGGRFQQQLGEF